MVRAIVVAIFAFGVLNNAGACLPVPTKFKFEGYNFTLRSNGLTLSHDLKTTPSGPILDETLSFRWNGQAWCSTRKVSGQANSSEKCYKIGDKITIDREHKIVVTQTGLILKRIPEKTDPKDFYENALVLTNNSTQNEERMTAALYPSWCRPPCQPKSTITSVHSRLAKEIDSPTDPSTIDVSNGGNWISNCGGVTQQSAKAQPNQKFGSGSEGAAADPANSDE